jgi:zinc protease
MIEFVKHTLPNGLRVIVHCDKTTPLAALNLIYNVGARDEDPSKTGFAHLFEHLMFGGSKHIPDYDGPLQKVGGENNAFTTNDITNYYLTVPAGNLETGFWLESDRMLELDFNEKSLDVQRNVVIEEFKQRYLNQPYGDVYPLLRELAYTVHPYRWPTIGKEISHIEQATLADVKDFFFRHYAPNNAVLTVTGNVEADKVMHLAEKWFGDIPRRNVPERNLPLEPVQAEPRVKRVERDVPYDGLYIAFPMSSRLHPDYFAADLISDILSNGESSRLYRNLVVDKQIFGELDAYISGDNDPGLFVVSGRLNQGVTMEKAETAVWEELDHIKHKLVNQKELKKVINKIEANHIYSEISFLNKAMSLSAFELLGDASMVNTQIESYRSVTLERLQQVAVNLFRKECSSTLYYHKRNKND